MVLVKFASRCDVAVYESLTRPDHATPCNTRSQEYTEWPTCRTCHEHVCEAHEFPGTLKDEDGRETVLCPPCGWKARQ